MHEQLLGGFEGAVVLLSPLGKAAARVELVSFCHQRVQRLGHFGIAVHEVAEVVGQAEEALQLL